MTTSTGRDQLESLGCLERAVVFLSVDWAVHSRWSRDAVAQMVEEWRTKHPVLSAELVELDVSSQRGELWDEVGAWLRHQEVKDAQTLMYSGTGATIWVSSGIVKAASINPALESLDRLLKITQESFTT